MRDSYEHPFARFDRTGKRATLRRVTSVEGFAPLIPAADTGATVPRGEIRAVLTISTDSPRCVTFDYYTSLPAAWARFRRERDRH